MPWLNYFSKRRSQIRSETQKIREDSRGGHLRSGARSLNNQRLFVVAFGSECYDVVASTDTRESVILRIRLQLDLGFAIFRKCGNVSEHFTFGLGLLEQILH